MLLVTTFSICSSLTMQFLNVWIYKGFVFFCLFFFLAKDFSFVVWKETMKIRGVYLIQCSFIESSDSLKEMDFQVMYMTYAYRC